MRRYWSFRRRVRMIVTKIARRRIVRREQRSGRSSKQRQGMLSLGRGGARRGSKRWSKSQKRIVKIIPKKKIKK